MSAQTQIPFDVCAGKHGGNPQSIAANLRAQKLTLRQLVYAEAVRSSAHGITVKEVAAMLNKGLNQVSGRLTELSIAGKIVRTGEIREGSAVYRADVYSAGVEAK